MKINEKNLCVFATSPPYDKEGFLLKKGEVNKAFQRRYFVLKGNLLFYFEKKGDKEPLGLIIVEGCTIGKWLAYSKELLTPIFLYSYKIFLFLKNYLRKVISTVLK